MGPRQVVFVVERNAVVGRQCWYVPTMRQQPFRKMIKRPTYTHRDKPESGDLELVDFKLFRDYETE